MPYKGIDRRIGRRFEIPVATVSYKKKRLLFSPKHYEEEFCPLLNISRRGLRFLCHKLLKNNIKVILKLSIPDEEAPLYMKGRIGWTMRNAEKSYKYKARVKFATYGDKKAQNSPGSLLKIISLEQKYSKEE